MSDIRRFPALILDTVIMNELHVMRAAVARAMTDHHKNEEGYEPKLQKELFDDLKHMENGIDELILNASRCQNFVFDGMPLEFLQHTGRHVMEQIAAEDQLPRLPYDVLFIQHGDWCAIVSEVEHYRGELTDETLTVDPGEYHEGEGDMENIGHSLEICVYDRSSDRRWTQDWLWNMHYRYETARIYRDEVYAPDEEPRPPVASCEVAADQYMDRTFIDEHDETGRGIVEMVMGALDLMQEQLVIEQEEVKAPKALNKRRIAKGKPPKNDYHVLVLNVAKARQLAEHNQRMGSHESPRLHWRRGHWRTIHRHQQQERKTWVRKCLVGDPEKGFVSKDYLVTHEKPRG